MPGELRQLFGWVVREGVTNVVRHSRAHTCRIAVTAMSVTVADDGRGAKAADGNGLTGLRERVQAAGGTVTADAPAGGGFRLHAAMPAHEPAADRGVPA